MRTHLRCANASGVRFFILVVPCNGYDSGGNPTRVIANVERSHSADMCPRLSAPEHLWGRAYMHVCATDRSCLSRSNTRLL